MLFGNCSFSPFGDGSNERKKWKPSPPSPYISDLPHSFEETHFNLPTFCDHCGELLWGITGKQGLQCTECNYVCHFKCEPSLTKSCRDPAPEFPVEHEFRELPMLLSRATYCNVCRRVILSVLDRQGYICKVCQYVTHHDCIGRAEKNCVRTCDIDSERMQHHWVEGNIHEGQCLHCEEEMYIGSGMTGFRCYWCGEMVHNKCKEMQENCTMGPLGPLKVPPNAIFAHPDPSVAPFMLNPGQFKGDTWPLLIFINKRSGGQQGKSAREALLRVINPLQIFDLANGGPDEGLATFLPLIEAGMQFSILVCGGDGTVSWVLDALNELELPYSKRPAVGILPLGTGNDLARTLGWGEGYEEEDVTPLLYAVLSSSTVLVDRWHVTINSTSQTSPYSPRRVNNVNGDMDGYLEKRNEDGFVEEISGEKECRVNPTVHRKKQPTTKTRVNGAIGPHNDKDERKKTERKRSLSLDQGKAIAEANRPQLNARDSTVVRPTSDEEEAVTPNKWGSKGKIFNNYFSLGIDANVALRFHDARQADPKKFSSRNLNKLHYFVYGASQMLQDPPLALQDHIQLELDGVEVPLPSSLEGLVFLNLPSYAGGADLWGASREPFRRASVGDKMLEVAGITSSFHLGQITAQASTAVQVGQGECIRVTLNRAIPCQVDGEPWLQPAAVLEIRWHSKAKMLLRYVPDTYSLIRTLDPSFMVFTHWEP